VVGGGGVAVGSSRGGGSGGDWNRDDAPTRSFPPPKSNARKREISIKGTSGDNDLFFFHSATKMLQSLFISLSLSLFSILYSRRFWKNTSPTTKVPTTTSPITIHKIGVEAADGGTGGAAGWGVGVAIGLAAGSSGLITGETGEMGD
jgi:hypothetical protein